MYYWCSSGPDPESITAKANDTVGYVVSIRIHSNIGYELKHFIIEMFTTHILDYAVWRRLRRPQCIITSAEISGSMSFLRAVTK